MNVALDPGGQGGARWIVGRLHLELLTGEFA